MAAPSTTTDDDLAQRIRSGDRAALGELYDRYASLAMGLAVRVVADRDAAEDVVHDAFMAVWQKIDRYDADRGSLRTWLLTIVRNRALDRLRRARPSVDLTDADQQSLLRTGPNPTWEAAVERLSATELRAAVDSLPHEQREAVLLAYFGGRTHRDVARLTGVPLGTANGRLRLALTKLRSTLSGGEAEPVRDPPDPELELRRANR